MNASAPAPFSHILCLVDGSEAGCRAAERSARLAHGLGAKLGFLAVGTEPTRDEGFEEYARVEGVTALPPPKLERSASECLNVAVVIASDIGVLNASRLTEHGDVVDAICRTAQSGGADLVVLRRQHGGLLQRLFGSSVTERFANECDFAVLSVT